MTTHNNIRDIMREEFIKSEYSPSGVTNASHWDNWSNEITDWFLSRCIPKATLLEEIGEDEKPTTNHPVESARIAEEIINKVVNKERARIRAIINKEK